MELSQMEGIKHDSFIKSIIIKVTNYFGSRLSSKILLLDVSISG
jgi:hypothetical protein